MALQTSGAISLNDLHVEAGGTSGTNCTMNDADIRGLISKGSGVSMSIDEWYGAANVFAFSITGNTANATLSTLATNAGWNGTAPLEVIINSGVWVYSTSTGGQGLNVNVANATIINYGYIIGRGGNGGSYGGSGAAGGKAMYINGTGCVVLNQSGGFIAGGGGGGGARTTSTMKYAGGGGAGGGNGGTQHRGYHAGGFIEAGGGGGGIGGSGGNGIYNTGSGGGAGGSGSHQSDGGAGGGGRILPGSGGVSRFRGGGSGGSGGAVGGSSNAGAGGGGWGASGGNGLSTSGGSGGAAISATQSYTLSNSGTIYGAT